MGLLVAAVGVGALVRGGLVGGPRDHDETPLPTVASPSSPRPSESSEPGEGTTAGDGSRGAALTVVSWGRTAGQLAVLVQNASDSVIERARVRITARDAAGRMVLSTAGTAVDVCCTVIGLPPGKEFGLFVPLPAPSTKTSPIATVEVDPFSARAWPGPAEAVAEAGRGTLRRSAEDTVVTGSVTAHGRLSGYVAVQALLTTTDGHLAQVISGRFYCFQPDTPRTVRLHLFHAVPMGLRLDRLVAYPIPRGVPPHTGGRCS